MQVRIKRSKIQGLPILLVKAVINPVVFKNFGVKHKDFNSQIPGFVTLKKLLICH